jgi:hypothetical protein
MKNLQDKLYEYAYYNWKFTPKSKRVLRGAASIVIAGIIAAAVISKKK